MTEPSAEVPGTQPSPSDPRPEGVASNYPATSGEVVQPDPNSASAEPSPTVEPSSNVTPQVQEQQAKQAVDSLAEPIEVGSSSTELLDLDPSDSHTPSRYPYELPVGIDRGVDLDAPAEDLHKYFIDPQDPPNKAVL